MATRDLPTAVTLTTAWLMVVVTGSQSRVGRSVGGEVWPMDSVGCGEIFASKLKWNNGMEGGLRIWE